MTVNDTTGRGLDLETATCGHYAYVSTELSKLWSSETHQIVPGMDALTLSSQHFLILLFPCVFDVKLPRLDRSIHLLILDRPFRVTFAV